MRVGVARRDISPSIGVDLCGFIARDGPCSGVHDPLYATALVADDGGRTTTLVVCDLIGLGAAMVRRLRSTVEARTGIPASAQMYACTHTHGGPDTGVITTTGAADPAYIEGLEQTLPQVVVDAQARMSLVRLGWARGVSRAAFNRRQPPGEEWPIDPDLQIARIEALDGTPVASILHYTCHPTATGAGVRLATADWCGVARDRLEAAGSGPVLVVNGAAGDVNAIMKARGLEAAGHTGTVVGDKALRLWREARPADVAGIAFQTATVPLALQPLPDIGPLATLWKEWLEIERSEPPSSAGYRAAAVTHRAFVQRALRYQRGSDPLPQLSSETQIIRLGPLMVVSLPGEFFNAYGRQIKAAAPGQPVMVAAWTNDNLGYFPTRDQYQYGGYEVDVAYKYYGFPAAWTAESGEAIVSSASALVREMSPGG